MLYALCPMPYARRVPDVTEKGYSSFYQLSASDSQHQHPRIRGNLH